MAAAVPTGEVAVALSYTALSTSAKLLELDEAMLAALVAPPTGGVGAGDGAPLHLKAAGSGDQLVLTTGDATYEVVKVETSNSMFLCRAGGASAAGVPLALEVQARLGGTLQVRRVCGPNGASAGEVRGLRPCWGEQRCGPRAQLGATELLARAPPTPPCPSPLQLKRTAPSLRRLLELLLFAGAYRGPADDVDDSDGVEDVEEAPEDASQPSTPRSNDDGEGAEVAGLAPVAAPARNPTGGSMMMGLTQYGDISGFEQYGRTQAFDAEGDSLGGGEGDVAPAGAGAKRTRTNDAGAADAGAKRRRGVSAGYTFAQLLSYAPMSRAELAAGLVALQAVRLPPGGAGVEPGEGGTYRLLDDAYALRALAALLVEAQAAPGGLAAMDVASIAEALADRFPPFVTSHVARAYSTAGLPADPEAAAAAAESGDLDAPGAPPSAVCLDFRKVAVGKALGLLRAGAGGSARRGPAEAAPAIPVASFMARWAAALPGCMVERCAADGSDAPEADGGGGEGAPDPTRGVLSLSLLSGHILLEGGGTGGGGGSGGASLRLFSHADMDDDPKRRFAQLFAARARWTEGA